MVVLIWGDFMWPSLLQYFLQCLPSLLLREQLLLLRLGSKMPFSRYGSIPAAKHDWRFQHTATEHQAAHCKGDLMLMIVLQPLVNTLASGWFWWFSQKNSSFWLPYQRPISSADCAGELFNGSNGLASLVDCTRKKNFLPGGCGFFVSVVISEVVLGSFWLMLPGLGPNH